MYGKKLSRKPWITISLVSMRARMPSALALASVARSRSPLRTTQCTRLCGYRSSRLTIVPPQPISMSSAWAPRQSTRYPAPRVAAGSSGSIARRVPSGLGRPPDLPGCVAARAQILQHLPVLERVHRAPEARVLVRQQLALRDQPAERLLDEILAVLDVVEDLLPEDEEAPVGPDVRPTDVV